MSRIPPQGVIIRPSRPRRRRIRLLPGDIMCAATMAGFATATAIAHAMGWLDGVLL